jgi:hypothetical protein
MTRKEMFEGRLKEIDPQFVVKPVKDRDNVFEYKIGFNKQIEYALIGLAAHFQNREWIDSYSYMYILKSLVRVTFNKGKI